MNLSNKKDILLASIVSTTKKLNLLKPKTITNNPKNILIEQELQGLDLYNITDNNKIKLLSADLTIFNDEAFRYYVPQFIYHYLNSYKCIFLTFFVPSFIVPNNSNRFLQFSGAEAVLIVQFFRYLLDEIEFYKNKFQNIDFDSIKHASNEEQLHYLDLLDFESDIRNIVCLWERDS